MKQTFRTSRAERQEPELLTGGSNRADSWPNDPQDPLKQGALSIVVEQWLDAVYTSEEAVFWVKTLQLSSQPLYGDPYAVMATLARDVFPALEDLLDMSTAEARQGRLRGAA